MRSSPVSSILRKLLNLIAEGIPSERVFVLLVNEENQVIFQETHEDSRINCKEIRQDIVQRALEEKHPVVLDYPQARYFMKDSNGTQGNIVCLPLVLENRITGALYLDRKPGAAPFSRKDLEFLIAISKPISLILRDDFAFKLGIKNRVEASHGFLGGQSRAFHRILTLIERVKDNNTPVFICGESGTGKELVARAIHQTGLRKKGRFIAVNCGAIPEHLLESELFGHVKGAFTGAIRNKPGLIEEADKGTFFLDEVGDLFLPLQAKLLRLLQEKELRRVGENQFRLVDARFISATNKNIEKEIERGNFREDLYYRLKIITIEIPPLRERKEDLLFLLNHFLEKYCSEMKREKAYFSPTALEMLLAYQWHGNVRELQNEIQRCLIFSGEDSFIKEEYLSPKINPQRENSSVSPDGFFHARAEFEKRYLNQALARWSYNRVKTAGKIGLSRQGLFKLIKKHKIEIPKKGQRGET